MSSYPVASIEEGVKLRTVGIDVADAATTEAVCSSYNSGISPFEDSVSEPPAGMSKPYLLRLTSACAWDRSGIASLVVEDGQENVIFNSAASPSTIFSEEAVETVEEIAYVRYVDMGLPSGLLWATCNIDASKPAGMAETEFTYNCSFFSWGNTDAHNPISNNAFEYNWGSVNSQAPWYENQPYGSTPGAALNSSITLENDAARAICGEPWRMPKASEIKELFDNVNYLNADGTIKPAGTTDKRITLNGVVGLWVQSKINGNRLFFACCGYGYNRSWYNRGSNGSYWSATYYSDRNARGLYFNDSGTYPQYNYVYRYSGFVIRPVREASRRRRKESEDESEKRLELSKNESEKLQVVSENKSKRRKKVSKNESEQRQEK